MKSEKGSITLYVLIAMLTFTAFLMAIYARNANKEIAKIETTEKIKAIYEDYDIDEVYATMTGAIPQILGYERGAKEITIKTLKENGINVDQNGKEIIYYAATTSEEPPDETSEEKGCFGKWQKSTDISLLGVENENIYIWIKNEDGNVSKTLENAIDTSGIQIKAGEYAGVNAKKYVDPTDPSKVAYIPAGFTVSNVEGETEIDEGLVIYSGKVTDWNTAQTEYNQYVWIPLDDPSDMYGTDANGNKLGKLYEFSTSGERTALNWSESNGTMKWNNSMSNREPTYLTDSEEADNSSYNQDAQGKKVVTAESMQKEFNDMITSVEKYKGFYIGRYELTGTSDAPTVLKGAWPLVDQNWYSFYQICEKLEKNTSEKVHTSMIWGCQWDQAIQKSVQQKSDFLSNPNKYGVYQDSTISNRGVSARMESAYNIFDMSGNVFDWTQEGYHIVRRIIRGGYYGAESSSVPADSRRSYSNQGPNYYYAHYGCRAQLYIL